MISIPIPKWREGCNIARKTQIKHRDPHSGAPRLASGVHSNNIYSELDSSTVYSTHSSTTCLQFSSTVLCNTLLSNETPSRREGMVYETEKVTYLGKLKLARLWQAFPQLQRSSIQLLRKKTGQYSCGEACLLSAELPANLCRKIQGCSLMRHHPCSGGLFSDDDALTHVPINGPHPYSF